MRKKIINTIAITSLLAACTLQAEPYTITVPKVPSVDAKVPLVDYVIVNGKATKVDHTKSVKSEQTATVVKKKSIIGSSHRVPPNYGKKEKVKEDKNIIAGDVKNNRVPAYLFSAITSIDKAIKNLKEAGFKIVSKYKVDKKGKFIALVFTNDDLEKISAQKSRGFAASIRLLVDTKNARISILNPVYMTKAYMQDSYDKKVAKKTLDALHVAFKDLKPSNDIIKFTRLPRYQFMQNMPFYKDMIKVASGSNESLLKKARKSKKVKLVYEQKLANGATLIGIKLSKRTGKFVKKIGYQNSQLLPYPILIENNEAKILDPKYYIALMYPRLSMSEFMTIATVPGAIQKDCDRVFR